MAFFALLAIAMVIASYLFVAILAIACVYLPYLLVSSSSGNIQILILFLFGVVIASAMLWSLVPRRDKFVTPGIPLFRADQPRLFSQLDDIAASLNEKLPGDVYLVPDANAFVEDRGGVMGFGSRRVMGLGLPLFSVLTVSQFRAVLAHEFAHYYGGDTSLGPWVYRTKTAIMRTFQNVGSLGQFARIAVVGVMYMFVAGVLKGYAKLFFRAINLVSRRQEYRADELACLVAGRQSQIDGLRAVHGAAAAWAPYWKNEVAPLLGSGTLPAVSDGFARFLAVPQGSDVLHKSLEKTLREAKTNAYDSHPPLRDRIAAAEKLPEWLGEDDPKSALTLLDRLPDLELGLVENRLSDIKPGTLKYISWDEVAYRVTIPGWQKAVTTYDDDLKGVTAETIPNQITNFSAIGSRIPDPKGMLLTPNQRTERAGQLFAAALALALVENGWKLSVQPGVFRLQRGDESFNPFAAVAELMAGKRSQDEWINQCNSLGISQVLLSATERKQETGALLTQPTLFDS